MNMQGCGTGYDPVMLALHGFEAYGLEISRTAVSTAEEYAKKEMENPSPYNFSSGSMPSGLNPGPVKFVQGDFFSKELESNLGEPGTQFDLVYDYTVIAAKIFRSTPG